MENHFFSEKETQGFINEILSQVNVLGNSFNLNGELSEKSCLRLNLDPKKAKLQEINLFDKKFTIPEYVNFIFNPAAQLDEIRANDKYDYLKKLTVKAKIDTKFTFFNSQFEVDFGSTEKSTNESTYCKKSIISHLATLKLSEEVFFTNQSFLDSVNKLPKEVNQNNLDIFVTFFDQYGLYYTNTITLGGHVNMFYQIDKSTNLNEADIKVILDAQIGAVKTGKFHLTTELKKKWEEQKSKFQISIKAAGGSPEFIQRMASIDIKEMTSKEDSCYVEWAQSVNNYPAITSIELTPIFNLVPKEYYEVVRKAFELFSPIFNPKLELQVESASFWKSDPTDLANKPQIKFNNTSLKADNAESSKNIISGYQVAILKNEDGKLSPAYNHFFTIDPKEKYWSSIFKKFYDSMAAEIRETNLLVKNNILLISSFNIDTNCCPTGDFYDLISENSKGEKMQFWRNHCDPGSMTSNLYIASAVNYLLVSQIETEYSIEKLETNGFKKNVISQLNLNFFRNKNKNNFEF